MARGSKTPAAGPRKAAKPGSKKPSIASKDDAPNSISDGTAIALELQQRCLNIFRDALRPSPDDSAILQEVKGHLYNRDFAAAFGREEYLRVYASRWSPSRALAYAKVVADLETELDSAAGDDLCAVCLGGGAGGELVALGAWESLGQGDTLEGSKRGLRVDLVDIADWHAEVEKLQACLTTPPELSKYASQAKKDANRALVPASDVSAKFHQLDILSANVSKQSDLASLLSEANLVTFMFTLNELYSTSLAATQALLKRITDQTQKGCLMLVVDSPGSYSTVTLNGAEKTYPMHWLLDHTLLRLKDARDDTSASWEKIVEDDSRWFRLSNELHYPISLEDMRYQIHLFRRF